MPGFAECPGRTRCVILCHSGTLLLPKSSAQVLFEMLLTWLWTAGCVIAGCLANDEFVYPENDNWKDLQCGEAKCTQCEEGDKQSPIALFSNDCDHEAVRELKIEHDWDGDTKTGKFDIENLSGTNLHLKYDENETSSATKMNFSGANLDDTYDVVQLHFHWGNRSTVGSEHRFGDKQRPLEMHVVGNKQNSKQKQVAVISVTFEIKDDGNNAALEKILKKAADLTKEKAS